MDPWYKVVTPRKEIREGRSFNPDEFAIHLEQVVAGTAPSDYQEPEKFFSRNYFTRALKDHTGMVLRRLSGQTENTSPVLTLITQFGGGKTHTLLTLLHLTRTGKESEKFPGVVELLKEIDLSEVPEAKTAIFVGNAWDPQEGRETPWLDVARQLAGDEGVKLLGKSPRNTPPGTEALGRIFQAAGGPVLLLFDEVLNFLNRHRDMAEPFHAFIQNLTVATTGTKQGAILISLPRSQVEMTDWDLQWQEKISRVVRRVAKDLIVNDESEVAEVLRRRLFENLGQEKVRQKVAISFADWCFERRTQLPPEWTAVDTATKESTSRELLREHFLTCYPFHPATLTVFQRKWQALQQYQQTRGTLAMLAQWISWAYKEGFTKARPEPLITLGSAPLQVPGFRGVVLGQLGETRLVSSIETDISGTHSHAKALDADTKGPLRDIHRRVGGTILFESTGGQKDKTARLPELRFAVGEPGIDTTSIDNAAISLESKAYFIQKVGTDGFRIYYKAKINKAVADRRASLDEETEVRPAIRELVRKEFEKGASIPQYLFPVDSAEIPDSPKLSLVIAEPLLEWTGNSAIKEQVAEWTKQRGKSPRLYPGSLVWCLKKPGRELRKKVEMLLAWKRIAKEVADGSLGGDYDKADKVEIQAKVKGAEEAARDEVWGSYRYAVLYDTKETGNLKVIDLGAGLSSSGGTLCGRVISALKSQALLNETVGAGFIERKWPPALQESGAWSLPSLRQSFLNGTLTRLLDPDDVLKRKICEFVEKGDFGLASGQNKDGTYARIWFEEPVSADEVTFESGVFLLKKKTAERLIRSEDEDKTEEETDTVEEETGEPGEEDTGDEIEKESRTIRLSGNIPPELWNRLGTKIIPKLKIGDDLEVTVGFSVSVKTEAVASVEADLKQILSDLGLEKKVRVIKE